MIEAGPEPRIYLDTNIFIGAFEGDDQTSGELRRLFKKFEARHKIVVTSELTLAELSVQGGSRREFYMGLLLWRGFIDLVPVTRDILIETGTYRAALSTSGRKMKLPDAVHCVTAVKTKCEVVFSADHRLSLPYPLRLISPSTDGVAIVDAMLDA